MPSYFELPKSVSKKVSSRNVGLGFIPSRMLAQLLQKVDQIEEDIVED
jgi:hypothetical protein